MGHISIAPSQSHDFSTRIYLHLLHGLIMLSADKFYGSASSHIINPILIMYPLTKGEIMCAYSFPWTSFKCANLPHHVLKLCTPGGCFTNVSRALQNILSKFVYCRKRTSFKNFKLKSCMWAQSHTLGTHTKFQLEILTINVFSGIVYFREIILESSQNVSETTPRA